MPTQESDAYAVVLGRVVAALRERRQWTQAQLAERIGVKQSSVSRIESGQLLPDNFTFRRLAWAFELTAEQLQATVESALQRTQRAAEGAAGSAEAPWWQTALAVAGVAGLVGLAAFAVAALLTEEEQKPRRR